MISRSLYSLYLAQQGTPTYTIQPPEAASAVEEFAAEELRNTLYQMIGSTARLRRFESPDNVLINLNNPDLALHDGIDLAQLHLGPEAFHLETRPGRLHLLAGGGRGVLYGVYDLLETLGCRWFTPEISHIPRRSTLILPALKKTGVPAFENRDTFNWECRDPLWWVRNRMNGWYTPVPEYMGGHIDYCGFVHTFYSLLPPEQYFTSHPEYYSLVAGQRRRDTAQLCLTNPDVLRLVTEAVIERMRTHPRATIFSVSQNDCQGYCECAACQAVAAEEGSQSGPLLRFVNAIAEVTSKIYPDKLIDTLAYQYSLDAPRQVTPHPNVRVRLCSINCCQGHEYGTCDHPESRRFLRALDEWGGRTRQLYIWHYATDFTHYPLPMPDLDELHDNINLYHRYGVHGVFIQGMGEPGGGAESMALRGYVVSKLLWKPDQLVWPLVDEFLTAYYGRAAGLVRRYLDIFHQAVRQDRSLHPSLYDLPTSRQYDDRLRIPADQALAEAETLVKGDQLRRVQLLRGSLRYVRLYRVGGFFRRQGDHYQGTAVRADIEEFDQLARLWKRAGLQRIREGEALDFTLHKLRSRLTAHGVEWLADGEQQIAIVPDLGGRLLEWHIHGRQWLAPAEPDSTWSVHPFSGGAFESAVLGMYSTRGWGEPYQVTRQGNVLALTSDLVTINNHRLRLSRRLWLEAGYLHIHSEVENCGQVSFPCGWAATWNLLLDDSQAMLKVPGGRLSVAWETLPETPGEALTLTHQQLASQDWQLDMGNFTYHQEIKCGFPVSLVLRKRVNPEVFSLEARMDGNELGPGEKLEAEQVVWIEVPC